MGSRGRVPKDPDRVLGHRTRAELAARAGVTLAARPPSRPPRSRVGWLPSTRDAWRVYWRSGMASLLDASDVPAVLRLFDYYDQHARAMDLVGRALVVRGSQGQVRPNPLADLALRLEVPIAKLEATLGLSPAARQRMGVRLVRPVAQASEAPETKPSPYAHLRAVAS
jgi:P27 family predicted phage terminase small subunit